MRKSEETAHTMRSYDEQVGIDLIKWKRKMQKRPNIIEKSSKGVQTKINGMLPEKYHEIITIAIKGMTEAVLLGSQYTTKTPRINLSLEQRDGLVMELVKKYKRIAMVEGAGTGAGGIILGLADFPLLLSIKMKLLYEIAAIYGFDTSNYKERIYILTIFELAFSGQGHTGEIFERLDKWADYKHTLSQDINTFDWRTFQQEYRDYLDLAKLMQMLPVVGAPIGAYVNSKLVDKLSKTAIQAYHMRWILK